LRGMRSDQGLWLGSLAYSAPLDASGWRVQLGLSQTEYELGREFASLQATGRAQVVSLGVSFPVVRSQNANLQWGLTYQHKRLDDQRASISTHERKRSHSVTGNLQFDLRDSLGGGGISYGVISWTPGRLAMDATLAAADAAATRGPFSKLNFDLVRLQALGAGLVLSAKVQAQGASRNLDSSEKMALGGVTAVRAYPAGEANVDQGWVGQFELRYTGEGYAPYVFFDSARGRTLARSVASLSNGSPALDGSGAGVRATLGPWAMDLTLAWRHGGPTPEADATRNPSPRTWLSVSRRFD
jgi:hemolysin activation/secretion protein